MHKNEEKYKQDIMNLIHSKRSQSDQIDELKRIIVIAEDRDLTIRDLNDKLLQSENERDRLMADNEEKEVKIEKMEVEISKIMDLHNEYICNDQTIDGMEQKMDESFQMNEIETSLNKLFDVNDKYKKSEFIIMEKDKIIDRLQHENDEMNRMNHDFRQQIHKMSENAHDLEQKLQKEVANRHQIIETLKNQLDESKEKLKGRVSELEEILNDKSEKLEEYENETNALRKSSQSYANAVITSYIEQFAALNDEMIRKNELHTQRMDEKQEIINEKMDIIGRQAAEIEHLQDEIEEREEKCIKFEKLNVENLVKINDLKVSSENAKKSMKKIKESERKKCDDLMLQIEELEETIKYANINLSNLASYPKEIAALQMQIENLQREKFRLNDEMICANEDYEKIIHAKDREIEQKTIEFEQYKQKNAKMSELNEYKLKMAVTLKEKEEEKEDLLDEIEKKDTALLYKCEVIQKLEHKLFKMSAYHAALIRKEVEINRLTMALDESVKIQNAMEMSVQSVSVELNECKTKMIDALKQAKQENDALNEKIRAKDEEIVQLKDDLLKMGKQEIEKSNKILEEAKDSGSSESGQIIETLRIALKHSDELANEYVNENKKIKAVFQQRFDDIREQTRTLKDKSLEHNKVLHQQKCHIGTLERRHSASCANVRKCVSLMIEHKENVDDGTKFMQQIRNEHIKQERALSLQLDFKEVEIEALNERMRIKSKELAKENGKFKKQMMKIWKSEREKIEKYKQTMGEMQMRQHEILAKMRTDSRNKLQDELAVISKEIEDKQTKVIRAFYENIYGIIQQTVKHHKDMSDLIKSKCNQDKNSIVNHTGAFH